MRWEDLRRSDNVEDRSDESPGGGFSLGGGVKLGGGALIVIVIASLLFGVDPLQMLGTMEDVGSGAPAPAPRSQTTPAPGYGPQYSTRASEARPKDPEKEFVARVLGDTEDVWGAVFQTMGSRYEPPRLVLFRGAVQSACGRASAAVGPFYCPGDRKLYLDTAFFNELSRRFGAPGDFAQAYVIAHEVGHHVQNLTGTMRRFDQQIQQAPSRRNALSVRLELQADCHAGVWGLFRAAAQPARDRRSRGRVSRGSGSRRRSDPETGAGLCGPGIVHPRIRGTAPALVQDRSRKR